MEDVGFGFQWFVNDIVGFWTMVGQVIMHGVWSKWQELSIAFVLW